MKSVCLIVLCVLCCGLVSGAIETRPNVLLIIVDDLRDHEMFAGANTVAMPSLDRLAARGLKFSHAYCQATFCNPSRSSFLTGLRPNTTGVHILTLLFLLLVDICTTPGALRYGGIGVRCSAIGSFPNPNLIWLHLQPVFSGHSHVGGTHLKRP